MKNSVFFDDFGIFSPTNDFLYLPLGKREDFEIGKIVECDGVHVMYIVKFPDDTVGAVQLDGEELPEASVFSPSNVEFLYTE